MADLTTTQLSILRHALCLSKDGSGQSFRNYFVTGPGNSDYEDCTALCDAGLMMKFTGGTPRTGGDPVFVVTPKGMERARERL